MEQDCLQLRELAARAIKQGVSPQDAVTQGLLVLLQLKEDSRALALQAEGHREETTQSKSRLEQAHLQLQNLLYEKEYYDKEIHACHAYRSNYTDEQIGLVPVEEFLAQASKEVLAKIGDDPHQLVLQRLSHELMQRKALVAKLDTLKKSKTALRQDVDRKRKVLEDLQQQLQALEETAKPLQTILAPHLSLRGMARNADLLPLPLYIIYSQLAAIKEAIGLPIRVTILGSPVEAESFAKSQAADPADAADVGPSAEPAAKRPRLSPAPASLSAGDDPYKVHPLSVLLEVQREVNGRLQTLMAVKFQYLLYLKLVTAHSDVRDDNMLLSALFPGDDGAGTSYESLSQLQGGFFKYDATRAARPYRWCQHLAGLDFAPALPLATQLQAADQAAVLDGLDMYRKQQRVIHVIARLRAVKTGDEALKRILTNLTSSPNPANTASYPKVPVTLVASCEEIKTQATVAKDTAAAAAAGKAAAGLNSSTHKPGQAAGATGAAGSTGSKAQQRQLSETQAPSGPAKADGAAEDGEVGTGGATAGQAAGQGAAAHGDAAAADAHAMEEGEDADGTRAGAEEYGEEGEDELHGGEAAAGLISAYLLTDVLDERQPAGGANPRAAALPKPPSRLYRMVLRNRTLEVELKARLYLDYPTRPPLLLVQAVYEVAKERRGQSKPVNDVNLVHWLEAEANAGALRCVPADNVHQTLLYQLLHLRLALDEFASLYFADAGGAAQPDVVALLQAKQKLRGRDRHLVLPVLP